jgi:DNA polymerase-3 subunit delta'
MTHSNGRDAIYPWQIKPWDQLCEMRQKQRLPHALLISGPCGIGKERFATTFGATLLCSDTSSIGESCGNCHACHLINANSHPDLIHIAPETSGQVIKVDQIREVVQFVNETSIQNGFRVIIINRAHTMNHNAANALLKTLEEPPANTLFILLSGQMTRLQATIRSRCQILMLLKPSDDMALRWLESQLLDSHSFSTQTLEIALNIAAGAPLKALSLLSDDTILYRQNLYQGLAALSQGQADPLQLAKEWHERDLSAFFNLLLYWLQDLLKLQGSNDASVIINKDYSDVLISLSLVISKHHLLSYLTHVQERYSKIVNSLNLNRQLLVEELFIRWTLGFIDNS